MTIGMSRRYWQRLLFKIRTFGVKFEIFTNYIIGFQFESFLSGILNY